ncbi:MAG: hypothetical protein ACRDCT_03050 [Shewanella sp.]|uniref:Histone chaperone RTT106/FACT complex subunit SPT16-like middle domain-containing protein n=1 Tax=Shewanella cutis TaxID=2766780 RepID=A0ABS9QU02_9GAMM|nr:hypothetical protein [Shewanella sp. PS-2]MCG9963834.1 hypothetical protein [Shewanella sp. PS-2]
MKQGPQNFIRRCAFQQKLRDKQSGIILLWILPLIVACGPWKELTASLWAEPWDIGFTVIVVLFVFIAIFFVYFIISETIRLGKAAKHEQRKLAEAGFDGYYIDIYQEGLIFHVYDAEFQGFDMKQQFVPLDEITSAKYTKYKGTRSLTINFANTHRQVYFTTSEMNVDDFDFIKEFLNTHIPSPEH